LEKYLIFVGVTVLLSPRSKKSEAFSPWRVSVDSITNIKKQAAFFDALTFCLGYSIFLLIIVKILFLNFYIFLSFRKIESILDSAGFISNTCPYRFLDRSSLMMYFTEIINTSGNIYKQEHFNERSKRFPSEQLSFLNHMDGYLRRI